MSGLDFICPHCGNTVGVNRIVQDRRTGKARGHCLRCKRWIPFQLPSIRKKLVYLDQSFLSDLCLGAEKTAHDPILNSLFSKLQKLKAMNRIALVISDVHCLETSAINEQYAENRKKLWQFQNALADGKIAANWTEVFVAQHRRIFANGGPNSFPVADIGLDDLHRVQIGMKVVMTNSWLLRIYGDSPETRDEQNNEFRKIIERQAEHILHCQGVDDCLDYIRGLYHSYIQQGITAWQQRRDFLLSLATQIPPAAPFLQAIGNVIRGLDGAAVLKRWSELLQNDPIGPCPSLRIKTALEAELLWTWYEGKRHSPKKFNKSFGLSRQNDIDHVAAFVPYVDALTTDKDMHNLCTRTVVDDEIKRFPCRIFSAKNYNQFEEWLDKLLAEL